MESFSKDRGYFQKFINYVAVPFGILGAIATLTGVYYQVRKAVPELNVLIFSREKLTANPPIPSLSAEYRYQDRVVKDLWRVKVQAVNNGTATLIAEGANKNVIRDGIQMRIRKEFDLIGFETINGFDSLTVSKASPNDLEFKFLQWRKGEDVTIALFLERLDPSLNIGEDTFVFDRVLADGNIKVNVAEPETTKIPQPLINRWSPLIGRIIRLLIYIFCGLFAFVGLLMPIFGVIQFREERRAVGWREKYLEAAVTHLETKHPDSDCLRFIKIPKPSGGTRINIVTSKSAMEWNELWADFPGAPPESRSWLYPENPNPWGTLLAGFVGSFGLLSLSAAFVATIVII